MAQTLSRTRTILVLALAAVALLLAHRLRFLAPVEQTLAVAVRPVAAALSASGRWLAHRDGFGLGASALRRENEQLREDVQRLLVAQADLRQTLQEGAALAAVETALGPRRLTGVPARVVGRSPDPTFQVFLINRGARQGIRPGAAAVVGPGIVVGTVLEVEPEAARILALTDPRLTLGGRVEDGRASTGLLRGTYGLTLAFDFLDKDAPLQPGMLVVTSGADAAIPAGLVVGRVQTADNPLGSLFQTATVAPAGTLRGASFVTIVSHA